MEAATGRGVEPRFDVSKTSVLPLDEPVLFLHAARLGFEPRLDASEATVLPVRRPRSEADPKGPAQ